MPLNNKKIKIFLIGFLLVSIVSCTKKEEIKYIAKVGDSYLTEDDIQEVLTSSADNSKFREEYIRQWTENELLFLAAVERGIPQSNEYKSLTKRSSKMTANSLLIEQIMDETKVYDDSSKVKKYFGANTSEFKLTQPAILFNFTTFKKYIDAENFRTSLFQNSWKEAVDKVLQTDELIDSGQEIFSYVVHELPNMYRKIYNNLVQNQISEVMQSFNGHFIVFQLLDKYDKNEIPNLSDVYDLVKERYIAKQREFAYKNYLKQLYSNYSSKIER